MEKLLKLVNIYRLALELACKDAGEYDCYDCDDKANAKTLDFLVNFYVRKAEKILDKA